ncbi:MULTISPECIES: hypothetical protein [unclassified Microbacterium]|uniref:hypothetical protein n=1 Tax=unclassified Microbacterium TaxID=2609290 RepID=UPI00214ACE08|nr:MULTISPECIES: hypothetical protein [unclassified Microbacterium]MCR2784346.1 hypothetical protein [Microbacterium sp. zg.B96]MDL5350746.1 hypothetical protein [Microbacterium sp. zg-YB36]WIM14829.1 hypothetical protein QNO11_09685 [Microbacterium sp. zg-B96]
MPSLRHVWAEPVFQRGGATVHWTWEMGEREHYWGFSFRPWQANEPRAQILEQWTSSDNDLHHTEHFVTRVEHGNLYRFSAIWVAGR